MTSFPKIVPVRLDGDGMARLRAQRFEMDGYRCQHIRLPNTQASYKCLRRVTWENGHLAHVKSRGAGGGDTIENTVTKCAGCHLVREHVLGER